MSYDNTNSGVLFANDKRQNDKQPTHTGSINIDGREYWLNAWVKTSSKDPARKFFSLAVKPKEERPAAPKLDDSQQNQDDGIPF